MADDGWDVHDALGPSTGAPPPAPKDDDGWDTHDALGPAATPKTSAYEAAGGRSTWGDVGQGAIAGFHQAGATLAGAEASIQPNPDDEDYWNKIAQGQTEASTANEQNMTPAAQAPGILNHPLVSVAEGAPPMAALAVPTAIGTAVAGPVGGALAGAAAFGGSTRGDVYNRLKSQGIEPTATQLNEATGLGAATGLAIEATGGAASKLPVSSIVAKALGIGGEGAVFGASGAAQEAGTQQAEIQGGKRDAYDPSAIVGAGESGGGMGLVFGALGAGRHGGDPTVPKTPDRTQTPGETTVARETPAQTQAESKPRATNAVPVDQAAAGPPAAPPKVDPAQAVALGSSGDTAKPEQAPGVTQGVTKPPAETVEQPKVAQPTAPPPRIDAEAPPAGDTTGEPPPLQPASEVSPTPVSASPVEDMGAVVAETPATLAAQHAALLDPTNDREAMVWPKGSQPIDIPDKSFGQVKLPDGRIVQFDKSGPSGFTVAKIRQYAKDDRLNEALDLGPVTKNEAIARVEAGERPAAVTERAPDGTEAKAAAGTTATAPDQVAALEATKTPGNTVQVEDPAAPLVDRAAQPQAPVVQPEVVSPERGVEPVTRQVTTETPFGPGRRVLADTTPEGIRAREAHVAEDAARAQAVNKGEQLKAAAAAKAEAKEAGIKERSHTAKTEQAKTAADNVAADRIVQAHPREELTHDWPNQTYTRAKAMVDEAKQAGIKIPADFKEGHPHGPAMLKLREAADLLRKDTPTNEEYGTFLQREHLIDTGRGEEAFAARRAEGAKALGSPEGVSEAKEVSTGGGSAAPEGAGEGRTKVIDHTLPTEFEGKKEVLPVKTSANDERLAALKAEMNARLKEEAGAGIKRREFDEATDKTVLARTKGGDPVAVTPRRSMTASEALSELHNPKGYSEVGRAINQRLIPQLEKLAGDTKVHFISDADMRSLGEQAHGLYDPVHDHILLNDDHPRADTMLHELFHAATTKAFDKSPDLRGMMDSLQKEMGVKGDSEEFLTRLMTEPDMQARFKDTKISPALAKELGIPKWRKMTAWEGALHVIRQALGLGPRDISAIEAAMSISERAMWRHPEGVGDAMEAGARGLGLKFQKMESNPEGKEEPPVRDQEAFIKSPSEKIAAVKDIDKDMMKGYVKDRLDNAKVGFLSKTAKFLSGTQLSDLHGKIFTDAKGNILEALNRARDKVSHTFNTARAKDRDMINRGYLLDRKYASRMGDYAELLNLSSRYNIHADREAPKVPAKPEDAPRKNWQTNAHGNRARDLYKSLPTELQDRYRQEKQYYRDKQQELAKTVLDKMLPTLDLDKDMEARVRSNDLTDDDWEKLDKLHASEPIKNAQRLINKKDVYFPGGRGDGRFVVTGRYEMPKGGSDTDAAGEKLADNKREFDTEKEAHDYVADTHLPAQVRETNYWTDPATGKTERKTAGEAASSGSMSKKYEVSLERQHTEMHDTPAEAAKARAEMEKAGVGELSGVLEKRNERSWSSIGTAEQRALERRIMNRDNLTTAEKQHLIESTRTLALGSQSGMSPHLLQSRKVAGAKFDSGEGLDSYSRAINQHIARNAHSADISQAMERLDNHENATRSDTDSTTRSIIANTMRDRVYDQASPNSKVSPLMHKLMTMSFINFLVRPSHIFLSQVHPYVYSVPMMAGRHGYWKALNAQRQAMKDLGGQLGNLGRGAKSGADVFRSLREKDTDKAVQLAHGGDPIQDMINRLTDKGERDALTQMYETQHLHSAYDQSMFSGGGADRTNAMMQQFTNAMEANNRLSTALAAYRLEHGAHGDAPNALQYARRVIEETHGVYSAGNTAPIFKNPLMRATLQFHQQPMNLAFMLYRNAFKAFKGDTEARNTLAYQLGTAALLGGMGGMPMDLPKLAGLATQPVTGMAPSDWDDKMRRGLADTLGPTITNAIMEGLPGLMGPLGPSLGHRMGFDAGLLNDEPKSGSGGDVLSWAAKNVVGAPGGMMMDWLNGLHSLEGGDYQKAAESFMPGSLKDFAKAYRLGTSGVQAGGKTIRPASYGDALLQTLGFSGVERERQTEGHYKLEEALKNQPKTVAEQLKAKQAAKKASGNLTLGQKVTPKNKAIVGDYANAYE